MNDVVYETDHMWRLVMARISTLVLGATLCLTTSGAFAQPSPAPSSLPAGASKIVQLYDGTAPGSEGWTWHKVIFPSPFGGGDLVRNIVRPTLTIFRPPNSILNRHVAIIVAPGGGFLFLSIDSEGYEVARALAAKGVTALVLQYRLQHTSNEKRVFLSHLKARLEGTLQEIKKKDIFTKNHLSIMDGVQAVRYVRRHHRSLGVDASKIGMVGFSAGGIVTQGVILQKAEDSHLDFAGLIYGVFGKECSWPTDASPVFMAVAANDPTGAATDSLKAFQCLTAHHHSAEIHVFAAGGHGFGMNKQGLTSDKWFREFVAWLKVYGFNQE